MVQRMNLTAVLCLRFQCFLFFDPSISPTTPLSFLPITIIITTRGLKLHYILLFIYSNGKVMGIIIKIKDVNMLDFSKPSISHAHLLGRLHKTLWHRKTYKKTHTKNQNKQYNKVSKKSSQTWFTISHFLICALKVTGPPSVPCLINSTKFNLPP